jgi:6-pyruvoyltetrahydropterin/6-carboxytetrahydropterin synthase
MIIQKKFHFCCSHRLCNPAWDEKKNFEVFGKCSGMHGHNYTLEVQVKGPVREETGMVIDFADLNKLVERNVLSNLDHKDLESNVPELKDKILTVETLSIYIWEKLAPRIKPPCRLHKLTMVETDNNSVEYYGPDS